MNESLSNIERQLRHAVESQRYVEVQRLVLAFCQAAEAHARALPPGDPRIVEITEMTRQVLGWTRAMVQSGRASLVLQLRQLPKVRSYLRAPTPVPAVIRLEA